MHQPTRLVVLVSGSGTNLQALLDACADPAYGARVVAVGADREDIEGLARAERAGIPTFVRQVSDFETREGWDASLVPPVSSVLMPLSVPGTPGASPQAGTIMNAHRTGPTSGSPGSASPTGPMPGPASSPEARPNGGRSRAPS